MAKPDTSKDINRHLPELDLSADHATIVAQLDEALREFGFFYVRHHGISEALLRSQFRVAERLFDLPLTTKQAMPFDPYLDIGYVASGAQTLNPNGHVQWTGDTKEQFMMTNNRVIRNQQNNNNNNSNSNDDEPTTSTHQDNFFAGSRNYALPQVPDHDRVTREYAAAAYALNLQLNQVLFDALQLDTSTQARLNTDILLVLKQMKYAVNEPSNPQEGKFGAGAHTDWGSFTILATDETPGLQIWVPDQEDDASTGEWMPVPPRPGCLIINSGDQIAHLTNNTYRSALHRVVISEPQDKNNNSDGESLPFTASARFSTAVFTYFGIQASVGPLSPFVTCTNPAQYPARTTQEYFHFKLHESMGK